MNLPIISFSFNFRVIAYLMAIISINFKENNYQLNLQYKVSFSCYKAEDCIIYRLVINCKI